MNQPDDEMERYLRQFQPRPVRALKVVPHAGLFLRWRLVAAAAAGVALLAGCFLWVTHRDAHRLPATAQIQVTKAKGAGERRFESPLALTRLALADNDKLESLLAEESRAELPSLQGEQSMLRALAKE